MKLKALPLLALAGIATLFGLELQSTTSGGPAVPPAQINYASAALPTSTITSTITSAVASVVTPKTTTPSTTSPSTTTTTAPVGGASATTTATNTGACGGSTTIVDGQGTWKCAFDDEFAGTSLNLSHWVPMTTAYTGYVSDPHTCYVDTPKTISVSGGYLHLTDYRASSAFMCNTPHGPFMATWYGGYVSSFGKVTLTYGRMEILARVPSPTASGLHSALWLYPESLHQGGSNPGEIDLAEMWSAAPNLAIPHLHYNYGSSTVDPSTNTNVVTNSGCAIDSSALNDYVLEWTPTTITMIYNGKTCLVDHWIPQSPLVAPQPFNQPFYINLTQALENIAGTVTASTPSPATMDIKYVRVWSLAS